MIRVGDVCKCKMHMSILHGVDLQSVQKKTRPVYIKAFEIAHNNIAARRSIAGYDIDSTILDAAIFAWSSCTWSACGGVTFGTEIGSQATLSPDVTACYDVVLACTALCSSRCAYRLADTDSRTRGRQHRTCWRVWRCQKLVVRRSRPRLRLAWARNPRSHR